MFKHDCTKHGHRFKARYSEQPNTVWGGMESFKTSETSGVAFKLKVYECDICKYCGKIVENIKVCVQDEKLKHKKEE